MVSLALALRALRARLPLQPGWAEVEEALTVAALMLAGLRPWEFCPLPTRAALAAGIPHRRTNNRWPNAWEGNHMHMFRAPLVEGFLSKDEVLARFGFSQSTLCQWIKDGIFPAAQRMPAGRKGWRVAEIKAWEA